MVLWNLSFAPLDSPTEAAGRSSSGEVLPATDGLFAAFGDQTQCRVEKHAGVKGLIMMGDAGLGGPFLALWWDTVEGFGKPVPLVVNQQITGGLWLPLGRFETKSVTFAE